MFSAGSDGRQPRDKASVRTEDFFLVPDDRLLIPQDFDLIADYDTQLTLVAENFRLIAQDSSLIGEKGFLILEGCLRH